MIRPFVILLLQALFCSATPITICSTGLATANGSGCGTQINSPAANNLMADGNWYVSSSSSGSFYSQAFVTVNNAFPVQNAGPWLANNTNDANGFGLNSSWITPASNQSALFINGTTF